MMLTPDSIIMGKVVDVVLSPQGGIKDVVSAIIPKLPAIAFMVIIKKCIENAGDVLSSFTSCMSSIFKKLFYTTRLLENCGSAENHEFFLKKAYDKRTYAFSDYLFPINWSYQTEAKLGILSYIRWVYGHKTLLLECEKDASAEEKIYEQTKQLGKTNYKKLVSSEGALKYCVSVSSKLYPSKKLHKTRQCYPNTHKCRKNCRVI
jgi:hypothetical protein